MARLSEEHYQTTAPMATPKPMRTSNLMRNIFKPRRSTSSTSPNTLTKPARSAVPPASDSLGQPQPPHVLLEERAQVFERDVEPAKKSIDAGPESSGILSLRHNPCLDEAEETSICTSSESGSGQDVDSLGQPAAFPSDEDALSSNNFDNQDELSTNVRDYETNEASHNHADHGTFVFKVTIVMKRISVDTNILHGDKYIGPLTFTHGQNLLHLQMGIGGIYTLAILLAAFTGPKILALTVWKMAIALLTYSIAGMFLRWNHRARDDMLLAPAIYIAGSAYNTVVMQLIKLACRKSD